MQTQFKKLTDAQWDLISPFLPLNRKRKHNLRLILDAIFYIVRTGTQWRNLNVEGTIFPYWQIVYYYFRVLTTLGIIEKLSFELVKLERQNQGKNIEPTANVIDSQSIKSAPFIPDDKGIDGNKKVNGRKRHIITETSGLIIGVAVTAANLHDGIVGCTFLKKTVDKFKDIKCIFADHTYKGTFTELANKLGLKIEIAAKPEGSKGFVPVKIRWVVERTFGWMNFFRRLSKDYERTVQSSVSMIYLAQIQILINRLA